jgi:hypothetical protein
LVVVRFRAVPSSRVKRPSRSSSTNGSGSGMIRLIRKRARMTRNRTGERRPEA